MDRDEVIRICIAEGVPIYHGKIDKTLFQAWLESIGSAASRASRPRPRDAALTHGLRGPCNSTTSCSRSHLPSTPRLPRQYGLEPYEGGRHPGLGDRPTGSFRSVTPTSSWWPSSTSAKRARARSVAGWPSTVRAGGGPIGWAVRPDDLDASAARLGLDIADGSRTTPAGERDRVAERGHRGGGASSVASVLHRMGRPGVVPGQDCVRPTRPSCASSSKETPTSCPTGSVSTPFPSRCGPVPQE